MKKKEKSQIFLQSNARSSDLTGNKKDKKRKQIIQLQHLKKDSHVLLLPPLWPYCLWHLTVKSKKISQQKKRNANTRVPLRPPTAVSLLQVFTPSSSKNWRIFFHSNNLFYTTKICSSQNSLEQNVVSYLKMNMWIWIIIIGHILNSTTAPKLYLFVKGSLLIRYRDKVKSVRANVFNDNLFKSNLIGIHSSWFRPSPGTSSNFCPQNNDNNNNMES